MAETLHTLSIISFVLSVIFIATAVVLWFVLKIPNVIGDLSGRNARKSIERMRQDNEKTGSKSQRAHEKKPAKEVVQPTGIAETGLLNENLAKEYDEQATGLLDESGETEALEKDEETFNRKPSSIKIQMIEEEMLIHTDEKLVNGNGLHEKN
jgi:hypothetical protein